MNISDGQIELPVAVFGGHFISEAPINPVAALWPIQQLGPELYHRSLLLQPLKGPVRHSKNRVLLPSVLKGLAPGPYGSGIAEQILFGIDHPVYPLALAATPDVIPLVPPVLAQKWVGQITRLLAEDQRIQASTHRPIHAPDIDPRPESERPRPGRLQIEIERGPLIDRKSTRLNS